jgi:hypothetical protein
MKQAYPPMNVHYDPATDRLIYDTGASISHLQPHIGGQSNGNRQAAQAAYSNTANRAGVTGSISGPIQRDKASIYAQLAAMHAAGYGPRSLNGAFEPWLEPPKEPVENAGVRFGEIIGWRIWKVKDDQLWPFFIEKPWLAGQATTGNPEDHGKEGIWAFKQRKDAIFKMTNANSARLVYGSVKLWGQVVEHELGYRAEMATVATLEGSPTIDDAKVKELEAKYLKKETRPCE